MSQSQCGQKMPSAVVSGIRPRFQGLSQSEGQIAHVLLTRSPLIHPEGLHRSTCMSFVLSQDQTLHECLPVIGCTRTKERAHHVGIRPKRHNVLAVFGCLPVPEGPTGLFQRNLIHRSGRGINFWR